MKNVAFHMALRARGLNLKILAAQSHTAHTHLSEVINGKPSHGHYTRWRLFPLLTEDEVRILGWTDEYDRWRRGEKIKEAVEHLGTSSTGNTFPCVNIGGIRA